MEGQQIMDKEIVEGWHALNFLCDDTTCKRIE